MKPACPCCDGRDLLLLGSLPASRWFAGTRLAQKLPGGNLYRCCRCQLKFRYPVQMPLAYQQMYDNAETSTWPTNIRRQDWELILGRLREHKPQGGRVLDFGCYTGGLLARMESGYQRYGVEINRTASAVAAEASGAQIWPSIGEIPKDLRFDAVIAADVVEHVQNPEDLIEQLASLLTEQGILIITTGDADNYLWQRFGANWWYCYYPEHIAFLSRAWLDYQSQLGSFTVARCEPFFYRDLDKTHRYIDTLSLYCYGLFPTAYLHLKGLAKRMLGRKGMTFVPGNGVSADHLLIVLTRNVDA